MDSSLLLQSVHYILPITIAILGLSIYLFGFQSIKEPDYSYINNIEPTRKKKQQIVKKNGVIPSPKPTTPLIKPKVDVVKPPQGKENVQPIKKSKKEVVDDAAELEQGDWLPAPIRGAGKQKNAATKEKDKQQQSSPKKSSESPGKKKSVLKEVQNKEPESIPAPVEVEPKQETPKKKEGKKENVKQAEVTPASIPAPEEVKKAETPPKKAETPPKKAEVASSVKDEVEASIPESDLWEESKSRGNKKKARARKD